MSYALATDHATYLPGSQVTVTLTITNTSSVTCEILANDPDSPLVTISGSSGTVWTSCGGDYVGGAPSQACGIGGIATPLAPGATATKQYVWDGRTGQGSGGDTMVAAGTGAYTVSVTNPAASAAFAIA